MMERWILLLTVLLALVGCGAHKHNSPADKFKNVEAKTIFEQGEASLAHGSNQKAITHFEALGTLYPFSPYAQQAQLNTIYAHFDLGEYAQSEAAAARYIHMYPRGKHVDYAYYMKGLANFNQDRGVFHRYIKTDLSKRDVSTAQQSFADFNELVVRFPHSPYAADAQSRMVFLRNLLAQQQLNIAYYYFQVQAYVAAINRAQEIVQHFRQSPQVIEALAIIAQSYHLLGLDQLADQSMEILALNFPESKAYAEVKNALHKPVKLSPPQKFPERVAARTG